jgi:PEP-CTERM motif
VGHVGKFVNGVSVGNHAVAWVNSVAIDLNTLIDPSSGWTLSRASSISDNGWIMGLGIFDPDGPGGLGAYNRPYVLHIPEPSSALLLATGILVALRRRRLE